MERILDLYCAFLKAVIALCLAVMVVLVFGNVVLRYGFNSGIKISEELSRWLLVWLTFLGAIVAVREHSHLGVDSLVRMLSPAGKRICFISRPQGSGNFFAEGYGRAQAAIGNPGWSWISSPRTTWIPSSRSSTPAAATARPPLGRGYRLHRETWSRIARRARRSMSWAR